MYGVKTEAGFVLFSSVLICLAVCLRIFGKRGLPPCRLRLRYQLLHPTRAGGSFRVSPILLLRRFEAYSYWFGNGTNIIFCPCTVLCTCVVMIYFQRAILTHTPEAECPRNAVTKERDDQTPEKEEEKMTLFGRNDELAIFSNRYSNLILALRLESSRLKIAD